MALLIRSKLLHLASARTSAVAFHARNLTSTSLRTLRPVASSQHASHRSLSTSRPVRDAKVESGTLTSPSDIARKLSEKVLPRIPRPDVKKVLVVGSGGLSIGQAGEFDYSGKLSHFRTHATLTITMNKIWNKRCVLADTVERRY